jgi:hypothetical protein
MALALHCQIEHLWQWEHKHILVAGVGSFFPNSLKQTNFSYQCPFSMYGSKNARKKEGNKKSL